MLILIGDRALGDRALGRGLGRSLSSRFMELGAFLPSTVAVGGDG